LSRLHLFCGEAVHFLNESEVSGRSAHKSPLFSDVEKLDYITFTRVVPYRTYSRVGLPVPSLTV
jgi:hypothetical protein